MSEVIYRENRKDGVYFAIYPTHYVKLCSDKSRNEWTHIIRLAYNQNDAVKDIYHDVHWAMSDQFIDGRPDRFWGLLNDAIVYTMSNYQNPLKPCATLSKTSI